MDVSLDRVDRDTWERLCDASRAPLQQRWAYGETVRRMGGEVCRLAVHEDGKPVGLAQILTRRLVFRTALLTRGPIWVGAVPSDTRDRALRMLRGSLGTAGHRFLLITPESDARPPFGRAIMTPATSATLALSPDMRQSLHGKWRNRLVKAEENGLSIRSLTGRDKEHDWLFDRERRQRLERGYRNLPPPFSDTWLTEPSARTLTLLARDRHLLAGMMFLRHGTSATYHLGWTSEEGRARSAHTLMLWRAMETLHADGVETLDLGLLDTERAPGLARFKLGTGAVAHRLGATTLSLCPSFW